ncbi:DNA/RNA nuclease SfsA [Calderihabitans maritimus]|uniref:Sugar fermentation stimulation protein homolog n=1 Tax=Calderihabitans maritimus TaxID=1246530 RepID=A0A1Z5HUP7_9FIRM|nr:DNA/RNA nuclease SfsA [Calderihabitans maritimus]GAW93010.1 XRE family transcriptional regulator [Calderihabitans maritimus]
MEVRVPFPYPLVPATVVRRMNRFVAAVKVGDGEARAHVPNSGRLEELLTPGNRVLLQRQLGSHYRTAYRITLAYAPGTWVSVDASIPNRLLHEALEKGLLSEFQGYNRVLKEQTYGSSRIDFVLEGLGKPKVLLEAKSVTLVQDGIGRFPDAPTARGRKHLLELLNMVGEGNRAAVVFVVQRCDARGFMPNDATDPAFGRLLRRAHRYGLEVYAYRCRVEETGISLQDRIEVIF